MRPPRLPVWLLGRVVPPGPEGDTIRGDLLEDFSARAQRSRAAASLWYWRAVLSILFRYRRPGWTRGSAPRQQLREALVQDVRYAFRTLVKAPAFAAVVLVTLGVGIGANTAIFSALNAVLLKPLPYPRADRLVRLVAHNPTMGIRSSNVPRRRRRAAGARIRPRRSTLTQCRAEPPRAGSRGRSPGSCRARRTG